MEDMGGKLAEMLSKERDGGSGRRRVIIQWESQVGENAVCVEEILRCHGHCRRVQYGDAVRLRVHGVTGQVTCVRGAQPYYDGALISTSRCTT